VKNVGVNSFKLLKNRTVFIIAAFAMVLSIIVPAIVQAAQVTERSIALSSSSADAENVSYVVKFTPAGNAAAFVIDFCTDSPLIEAACAAPAGFDVTSAASVTSGFTGVSDLDANTVRVTGTMTNTPVEVELTNIHNPTAAGTVYARIVTYDTELHANAYTSADLGTGDQDSGSVAIAITNTIGVSGAVLESMTFCAAKVSITKDCANAATQGNAPVLRLGETVGSVIALVPGTVSTGSIYTQISTNAVGGAVISLKSSAAGCGGLVRAGDPASCDIKPALQTGVAGGEAKFGVLVATDTDPTGATPTGIFQVFPASGYNDTTYAFNYAALNASGVTSTYGDQFLNTNGAPANNKNLKLTFGVSVNNATPAGLYSADLGLIATGKF